MPPSSQAQSRAVQHDVTELRSAILNKLTYDCGKTAQNAVLFDWYRATALAVRERVVDRWLDTDAETASKRVYYFSIEFLMGRLLFDVLINFRLLDAARDALQSLNVDLDSLRKLEPDAALGN